MYQYDNLQQWLCYFGTPLGCKETMPLAYHVCKSLYMWNVDSLSNVAKFWVRMIACSMLCAKAWMIWAWLTVLQKHERPAPIPCAQNLWQASEKLHTTNIPLSELQRRARHALAHDKLLQMGSYGIYSALSSTKYIWYIDVDLFRPVSESIGCKRQLACLGCARSWRDLGVQGAPEGCSLHKNKI